MTEPVALFELDGDDVSATWGQYLNSLSISDEAGVKADSVEIVFDNRSGFSAPPIDAMVKVWLGYVPKPVYMGRYRISAWRKRGLPQTLTVTGRAVDFSTDMKARKRRSWHDTTVGAIVNTIASDHGISAVVDAKIGARAVPHIDQQTESDMAFLTRLARRQGAVFKLGDNKILFAAKGSAAAPSGKPKSLIRIIPLGITDWDVGREERAKYKSVITTYVDPHTKRHKTVKAGSGTPAHRDPRRYGSEAAAKAAANAQMADLGRANFTGNIRMPGRTDLYAEAPLFLDGFDPDVDGDYLVKTVQHSFSGGGFTTEITFETKGTESTPAE